MLITCLAVVMLVPVTPLAAPVPSLDAVIVAANSPSAIQQDVRHPVEGLAVWIAGTARIPVGLEIDRSLPEAEILAPGDLDGLTIRAALDAIMRADPRYEWKDLDGVPVVRPHDAWRDPRNPLNRSVSVHWVDEPPRLLLDRVIELLYGFEPNSGDYSFDERRLSVDIQGGSIVDVLNGIVRGGDLCWRVYHGTANPSAYAIQLDDLRSTQSMGSNFQTPPRRR